MENISLDVMPRDGEQMLKELAEGKMVVARSKNDFMYIVDFDGQFHVFTHSPGAPGGGQRQFPKDEQHTATIRKLADLSDSMYVVEFDKSYNIYGVLYTAEEGILSMFPGDDRDNDGLVDFSPPEKA